MACFILRSRRLLLSLLYFLRRSLGFYIVCARELDARRADCFTFAALSTDFLLPERTFVSLSHCSISCAAVLVRCYSSLRRSCRFMYWHTFYGHHTYARRPFFFFLCSSEPSHKRQFRWLLNALLKCGWGFSSSPFRLRSPAWAFFVDFPPFAIALSHLTCARRTSFMTATHPISRNGSVVGTTAIQFGVSPDSYGFSRFPFSPRF